MTQSDAVKPIRASASVFLPKDPAQLRKQLQGKYMALGYANPDSPVYYWIDIDVDADNSVKVSNLMNFGTTVTGTFDPSRKVVSIPRQVIVNHDIYGELQIIPCDLEKKVYYVNEDLEFAMNADGSLTTGNWGAFVMEGENKGKALAHYADVLYPAKATMTDYSETMPDSLKIHSYPVVFVREGKNKILIKNFYNYRADVVLTLDSLGGVNAAYTKILVQRSPTGAEKNFFNWTVTDYESPSSLKMNSKGVPGTYSGNTITLGRWAVAAGTAVSNRYDVLEKSVIEVPEEFMPFSNSLSFEGKGTAEEPYLIKTAEDLCQLSSAVNYEAKYVSNRMALNGVHFKQTADIDMWDVPNFDPIGFNVNNSPFCGIYDGDGHCISNLTVARRGNDDAGLFGKIGKTGAVRNLKIHKANVSTQLKNRVGVLAAQSEGVVENITVTESTVSGGNLNIGGIIGSFKGSLKNSSFTGTVSGKKYLGGLIGVGWGQISDCESRADIYVQDKTSFAGGAVGSLTGDSVVMKNVVAGGYIVDPYGSASIGGIAGLLQYCRLEGSTFIGHVYSKAPAGTTSTASVGGIAGAVCAAKISDCLMSGRVESPDAVNIAGLVGKVNKRPSGVDEPRIESSLVTGMLTCNVDHNNKEFLSSAVVKTVVSGCKFDSQTFGRISDSPKGMLTSRLADGEPIDSLSVDKWHYKAGSYPVPAALSTTPGGHLAAAAFILSPKDDINAVRNDFTLDTSNGTEWKVYVDGRYTNVGHGMNLEGGRARLTSEAVVCDTLVALQADGRFKIYFLKIMPQEYDGDGTMESPYLIRSVRDIYKLSNAVDVQGVRYTDTYFRLENDLDFTGVDDFIGFSSQGVDKAFNGIFDGNGHSIKNWKADRAHLDEFKRPTEDNASTRMAGFFLFTGRQSVVRNLTIDASCSVTAGSHVAALVSQNYGLVENCRNYARVLGIGSEVGGLVAANYDTGIIRRGYNGGAVDCGSSLGGGIAAANLGVIDASINVAPVTNDRFSTATPPVDKMGSIGGLVGYNFANIENSINFGTVTAPSVVGGLVGDNKETGRLKSSLSLGICNETKQLPSHGAVMGSQKNLTDSLEYVYYDSQVTASCDGDNGYQPGAVRMNTASLTGGTLPEGLSPEVFSAASGRYPLVKGFETEPEALFMASALVMFKNDDREDSRFFMRRNAYLSLPEGASAATLQSLMKVANGNIEIGAGTSAVSDTLVITGGAYRKIVPLFAPGRLLAEGDGSEKSPWLIRTPADWNTIAGFTDENHVDMRNEYFRIDNDIDFSGKEFKPWYRNGSALFQGKLDGAGHTIDNVVYVLAAKNETANNVAMIGQIGVDAEIRNLTLGNGCRFGGYDYVGSFVVRNGGLIVGCTNNSSIVESSRVFCGGISGYVLKGARFVDCVNNAPVKAGSGQVGGIAGGNSGEIGAELSGCKNYGSITSGTTTGGGIIGSCRIPVTRCYNEGDVTVKDSSAGGIVGYQASAFAVTDCENRGNVSAGTDAAGGIVGNMGKASAVARCVNSGEITASGSFAGGVIGTTGEAGAVVEDCINRGAILAGKDFAGGIAGECELGITMTNVRNYGSIKARIYAGGISGALKGNIDTAMNAGSITVDNGFAGGLIGVHSNSLLLNKISYSFNTGEVKSLGSTPEDSYCVGGVLGGGPVLLENVYNVADVTGCKFVGGLVGLADSGSSIVNAYNAGGVDGKSDAVRSTCGNISGKFNSSGLTNVYFDRQQSLSEYDADKNYTSKLTREMNSIDLGEAFSKPTYGGYPVLKAFETDSVAILNSSALALDDADSRNSVSTEFSLLSHPSVEWSSDHFTIADGKVAVSTLPNGDYTLTAKSGNFSREFRFKIANVGVDITTAEGRIPVEIQWYGIDGKRLSEPSEGVCLKVSVYEDGKRTVEKVIRRVR